jgi:hypothetical protein
MSYKITISGTILEKCIEHVAFNVDTLNNCVRNSIIITGKIDTDESTVALYNWALLSGANADCYKEVTVEQYQKDLLVRKVTFSKAFVVDYSESYSNFAGVGTFTLYVRQFFKKEIVVSSQETTKSNAVSEVSEKVEETVKKVEKVAAVATPVLAVTKKGTKITDKINKNKGTRLPKSNGKWSGKEGNSAWIPDKEFVPTNIKTNPKKLSWNQISQKHGGVDRINFKENKPDFTTISKGKVEIEDFGTDRNGENGNFKKADKKLAEQRGCTAREVKKWRKKNIYTWHEAEDCKTMYKVPNEIHGNVPHNGGISAAKKIKKERTVAFDE